MKKRNKKIIAPIIIVTLLCIYYLGIGIFFLYIDGASLTIRILAVVIPAVLTAVSIGVLIQRIIEVRKGEEDDLSKY